MNEREKFTNIGELKKQILHLYSQSEPFLKVKESVSGLNKERMENFFSQSLLILNQIFLFFLSNRIQNEGKKNHNTEYFTQARKLIATLLSKWEEILGKSLDNLYESERVIHLHYDNPFIFDHFRKIGFCIDYFDFFYKDNIRWQTSLLAIRHRFVIILANAINLKKLIKECDPEFENYTKNLQIYDTIKMAFEECIEGYWNKNIKAEQLDMLEMNKALLLINFLKNLTSVTGDRENYQKFKKKYTTWNKYIESRSLDKSEKT